MKKVTLLVASVLCSLGAFAQSSIEQLPTEIGKTTYQLVTPRGTLYYDKTIEESYLTSNCMTGRNENDNIRLEDERGQFLVIPANSENNTFYLYSVEAKKFVNHAGQYKAGLTDEPTEIAMWAHGATENGSQAYNHASFSYADYPFTIADSYVEGVTVAEGKHLNSINVCCWDKPANPDYRWCDTSHLDDGNAFKFVVAGEVSLETYNEVRVALGLEPEVVVPENLYPVNWDKEANLPATRADRVLHSVTLTTENADPQVAEVGNTGVVYNDFSNVKFNVKPGETANINVAYKNAEGGDAPWMHTYVYVDVNNDGQFEWNDVTPGQPGSELLSYAFWSGNINNENTGYDSNNTYKSGGDRSKVQAPAFVVPSTPGEYRMRVKIDWNCIDPAGQYGENYSGNFIDANGGYIVDITLNVEAGETPVDPEPPVVEGPQAAFTLTNLSSTADNYSFPIEVPAEFAAPVLEAKATTTVIEFVKTAGNKAAFVASTDGGNNFYANITLADNRIGFDYMMDNGAEGWFTKTQAPYTNLNTTVRVALTQDEESGLLNWYDAETGQQINSTNVSTNSAWGARSFGSKGYSHLYVGGYLDAAGNAQYVFPGEIASVRVYPQLLTTEEMTSLTWEGLEDSFDYIPEAPAYDYAKEVAPVLAEANAALEGHDNVWVTTIGDKLITRNGQFSSPHGDPSEGSINNLLDNNANTFWHSNWHAGNQPAHSHYLQVALDEAIDGDVLLTFVRRNAFYDQVTLLDVETSMDGENFAHAAYIDMPNSGQGKTEQKVFNLAEEAKFLRFWADATTSSRGYWHVGDFQLQTVETNLNIDAPDYAYPTAVAALQEAIATAQAVENGTQEDVDALAAAVEAYKAALAGYPEFTEWTGDVQVNAGNVTSIDDLLNVDFCFNRALSAEASGYGVLGVVFDHTGDAYALAFDALFGGVEVEKVKADGFVGNVAHVQFEKIADLTAGLQDKAKGVAAKIGGFQAAEGHALVVLASKSFLVDGEQYNALVKADYELTTGTITGVENLIMNGKGEIYDLQGRRVNNAQNGLFIQNGRVIRK